MTAQARIPDPFRACSGEPPGPTLQPGGPGGTPRVDELFGERTFAAICSELGFVDVAACRALVLVARGLGPGRRLVLHDGPRNLRVVLETAGWDGAPELVLDPM